jgi:hypothetical protein
LNFFFPMPWFQNEGNGRNWSSAGNEKYLWDTKIMCIVILIRAVVHIHIQSNLLLSDHLY